MDVDRRSFVKGIAAGGALLALGAPRRALAEAPAGIPASCTLLLGHPTAQASFARGARGVLARAGCSEPGIVGVGGGPVAAHGAIRERMERSRGTRWIAVLDDAGAAVFQEMIRASAGRLLARGSHACSQDGSVPLRHAWVAASPAWSAGAILASSLIATEASFSVAESFVGAAVAPSPAGARRDLLVQRSDDWVECVGQAVTIAALGLSADAGPPGDRSFRRRAEPDERIRPTQRLASFVVDV